MRLTVLGTGTVAPSASRVAPAHWVEAGPVRLLMDCGAGALHRAAAIGISWPRVTHVALTHFHVDHWGELPHLLLALRWGTEPARVDPLTLLGPRGLAARLTHLAAAFGAWVLDPDYPLQVTELAPREVVRLAPDVELGTCPTPHTEASLALDVRHGGRRLVYTGDTGPSDDLAQWARECDLLLAECSLPEDRAMAIHLTPAQAGTLARAARARHLVLTHLYPPLDARAAVAGAAAEFDGVITAAEDGAGFTIDAG